MIIVENKGHPTYIIPRKTLIRLYYKEGLSLAQVGKPYHLSREAVRWQMINKNLPRRKKAYANQYTMVRPKIVPDGTVEKNNG